VLQWRPAKGENIQTPNTNEIVVMSSFFQYGFGLPTYEFLYSLLHHYQIELVHLNPNSILQIDVFVHLCQPGIDNRKIIGGVGIRTHPRSTFLNLSMKTSLKEWLKS
jgi:hypothetical protein